MKKHSDIRAGNTNSLILLIMLVIITTLLSFFAWESYKDIEVVKIGNPEGPIKPSDSMKNLDQEMKEIQEKIDALKQHRDDLEDVYLERASALSAYNIQVVDGNVIGDEKSNQLWLAFTNLLVAYQERSLAVWDKGENKAERIAFEEMNNIIASMRDSTDDILNKINDEEDAFNTTQDRLNEEKDELDDADNKMTRAHNDREARLKSEKLGLETDIRELLELELTWLTEVQEDGELLEAAEAGDYAVINLGSEHSCVAGLRFEIFNIEKGMHVTKGFAEVIEVGPRTSSCRILRESQSSRRPITNGDKIGNPVFSPNKPRTFVLAGEFQRYNAEDIANFIRQTGGIVRKVLGPQDSVGPNDDFIIAGKDADLHLNQAREFHVIAMTEDYLLDFVQTTFSTAQVD